MFSMPFCQDIAQKHHTPNLNSFVTDGWTDTPSYWIPSYEIGILWMGWFVMKWLFAKSIRKHGLFFFSQKFMSNKTLAQKMTMWGGMLFLPVFLTSRLMALGIFGAFKHWSAPVFGVVLVSIAWLREHTLLELLFVSEWGVRERVEYLCDQGSVCLPRSRSHESLNPPALKGLSENRYFPEVRLQRFIN